MEVDELDEENIGAATDSGEQLEVEGSDDNEYVVEKIIRHKKTKSGVIHYFLKWKGYPQSENTWEKEENVYATDLIEAYWRQQNPDTKKAQKSASTKGYVPPVRTVQSLKKLRITDEIREESVASEEEYPPPEWTSWEEHVAEVETVERDTKDGELLIYVNWKDGHRTVHPATEANIRCPQKIIHFYENHLRFKNAD
ncbi:hypothetical protein G9A89_008134 [Geosiphon pyriformis]|nr:hypothetical protein G9A89_008134 [Geosiphon pyriformis]